MSEQAAGLQCALPVSGINDRIQLGHGAGTRMTRALIDDVFAPAFGAGLSCNTDSALLQAGGATLAFTTDAHVIDPPEFPGGDIGSLAVCGTLNDLAMAGAAPLALSAAFILEEGLEISLLRRVVNSMAAEARDAGVSIVTGDTKVVERGKGDGIFITTTGVGRCRWDEPLVPTAIREGDLIVLNGDLGRHAVTILAQRQGFLTQPPLHSDVMNLQPDVARLHAAGLQPRCMRDLTRGGLGMALLELAAQSGHDFVINAAQLPVLDSVRSVVDTLGLELLFLANEGRFVSFFSPQQAEQALAVLSQRPCITPVVIGEVMAGGSGRVNLRNDYGVQRALRMPLHEPLPRIC